MRKHVVIGTFGASDNISDLSRADEQATMLPLVSGNNNSLSLGLGLALNELYELGNYPSEIGMDLMLIATHVFAADTRISRKLESQDSWTREIRLIVPVSNIAIWTECADRLKSLLDFLTGDRWDVEFRARPIGFESLVKARPVDAKHFPFTKLQLFSGGLDSLIRTIDNLEHGESPLLISHAGDGATSDAQNECLKILKTSYPNATFDRLRLWLNIKAETFNDIEIESSTRGRSFLFFSLGIFAGSGITTRFVLEAPENGLIALNVPLDVLRLGSLSTHTTHPFYIDGWNDLLRNLDINGQVVNPYWELTKGEMVEACANKPLLQQLLSHSMSCSSPSKARWKGDPQQHCGYCLPCLIRRASVFNRIGITDTTTYSIANLKQRPLKATLAEGTQVRSFQVASARLRKNPNLAKFLIHKAGPLRYDEQKRGLLANVYLRGMNEIGTYLNGVVTEP